MRKIWNAALEHLIPSPSNTYRPYVLRKPWLIFFVTIILTAEGVFAAGFIARQAQQTPQPAAVLPGEVIAFTNVERARASEVLLTEDALLDAAAQAKADDMAAKGYFSHVGPDGKEPWAWIQEANYGYRYAGENLAVRFDDSVNVVNAWMASPTHRANIVKGVYANIGVGVAKGTYEGAPATFVVQYFGTPLAISESAPAAVVSAAQAPEAAVAGAQTSAAAPVPTSTSQEAASLQVPEQAPGAESIVRQAGQAFADSSQSSSWVVGGVLLFVLLALALAFFIHIEIQSHELLIGGVVVAGIAALFLMLNLHLPGAFPADKDQAAAVANIRHSVLVGDEAFTIQTPPIVPSE